MFADIPDADRAVWDRAKAFADEVGTRMQGEWDAATYPVELVGRMGELELFTDGIEHPELPHTSPLAAGLVNMEVSRHDGSLATLWDVMDHYNKGGVPNPNLDGGMQRLGLTETQIDDMVAFMETLTSSGIAAFGKQEMAKQRARKTVRPERDVDVAMGRKGDLGDITPDPDPAHPAAFGVLVRQGTSYEQRR